MPRISTRIAIAIAAIASFAVAPTTASAALLVGAEANGELVNSDRTPELQAAALDKMKSQGVQILRANLNWGDIAVACGGESLAALASHENACYNWGVVDNLVRLATERRIQVLVSVSRTPVWLHNNANGYYVGVTPSQVNHTITHYTAFIKAAGTRYKQGSAHGFIQRWTIWNEPNSSTFWAPKPNATQYAQMYGAAAVALRGVNAKALIAPGPTGPKSTVKPVPFITSFQTAVVKYLPKKNTRSYISAWAHNPYPANYAPTGRPATKKSYVEKGSLGMAQTPDLIKLLDKKPVTKKLPIWATEFGWETKPDDKSGYVPTVTRAVQAQYVGESYAFLSKQKRVAIGIWYGLTDNTNPLDWQSGTFDAKGIAKPSYAAYQRMISTGVSTTKKRQTIALWGRSTIAPTKGKLVYRTTAAGAWKLVPKQRRAVDGSITANFRVTMAKTWFAVRDDVKTSQTRNQPVGPARLVTAR